MSDADLLTMILSALMWQRENGEIRMITDSRGHDFLSQAGLNELWSEPIATELDALDGMVDPYLFWAAGKLYALGALDKASVMLDTDMIVWKNIQPYLGETVTAAHGEELDDLVYPDPKLFSFRSGYAIPNDWDLSLNAVNTAFLYVRDDALRREYVHAAFEFMSALVPVYADPVVTMCFAEQRILPMCAHAHGKQVSYLFEAQNMHEQQLATHTWGYKKVLTKSVAANRDYCRGCVRRIAADFPEWTERLEQSPVLGRTVRLGLAGIH